MRRYKIMLMDTETGAEAQHTARFTAREAKACRDRLNASCRDEHLYFYVADGKLRRQIRKLNARTQANFS